MTSSTPPVSSPVKIFISYAKEDKEMLEKLSIHLAGLKRNNTIQSWDERAIMPGETWQVEAKKQLEAAQIILLLISPSFINSDYCYEQEMNMAVQRHKNNEAKVIPIIVKHCDWKIDDIPFSKLQSLPRDADSIPNEENKQDKAFANVAREIRKVVKGLQKVSPPFPLPPSPPSPPPFSILWLIQKIRPPGLGGFLFFAVVITLVLLAVVSVRFGIFPSHRTANDSNNEEPFELDSSGSKITNGNPITHLDVSNDQSYLALADIGGNMGFFHLDYADNRYKFRMHYRPQKVLDDTEKQEINGTAFDSRDYNIIFMVFRDDGAAVVDKVLVDRSFRATDAPCSLEGSKDSDYHLAANKSEQNPFLVIASQSDEYSNVYALRNEGDINCLKQLKGSENLDAGAFDVDFRPGFDGLTFASAHQNNEVLFWKIYPHEFNNENSGRLEKVSIWSGSSNLQPDSMDFSPNGELLAIGYKDGTIKILELSGDEEIAIDEYELLRGGCGHTQAGFGSKTLVSFISNDILISAGNTNKGYAVNQWRVEDIKDSNNETRPFYTNFIHDEGIFSIQVLTSEEDQAPMLLSSGQESTDKYSLQLQELDLKPGICD